MRRLSLVCRALGAVVLGAALYGCNAASAPAPKTPVSTPSGSGQMTEHDNHAGHEHGDEGQESKSDMEKMKEGLAKLSEEDRQSAEKQHVCPVSGKMLGTMGAPAKVAVDGQEVWICCPGCEDRLLEKADEYLAKLKK